MGWQEDRWQEHRNAQEHRNTCCNPGDGTGTGTMSGTIKARTCPKYTSAGRKHTSPSHLDSNQERFELAMDDQQSAAGWQLATSLPPLPLVIR